VSTPPHLASTGAQATPPHREDGELVARARKLDVAAVEELCERLICVPRMAYVLNARTNSRLRSEDLRDLCQDVLVIVWKKLAEYDANVPLEAWVLGIVRLELMNWRRRIARGAQSIEPEHLDHHASPTAEPDHDRERLLSALARLGAEDSQIIRQRLVDELEFDDIAEQRGMSITAVKSRYYRSLQWLRVNLDVKANEGVHGEFA
jgi:RNA polymerase sigma-70 factor (ECF subfamily)